MKLLRQLLILAVCSLSPLAHAQEERNLMVDVRIEGGTTQENQQIGVITTTTTTHHGGAYAGKRTVQRSQNNTQRILVRDGGTATLSSVQTQPLRLRQVILSPYGKVISETYVTQSLGGGIRVSPQSQGNRVLIEVSAEEARPVPNQPMAADTLRLSTQVSGQMGEWILIGDDERNQSRQRGSVGLGGAGQGNSSESGGQRVWLRVTPQ